jgi:hypothetical protein
VCTSFDRCCSASAPPAERYCDYAGTTWPALTWRSSSATAGENSIRRYYAHSFHSGAFMRAGMNKSAVCSAVSCASRLPLPQSTCEACVAGESGGLSRCQPSTERLKSRPAGTAAAYSASAHRSVRLVRACACVRASLYPQWCSCVFARVCACARAWVCVRARVCACARGCVCVRGGGGEMVRVHSAGRSVCPRGTKRQSKAKQTIPPTDHGKTTQHAVRTVRWADRWHCSAL